MKKMVAQTKAQKLENLINFFFEENSVQDVNIRFNEPLTLNEKEFKQLIGAYDSSNTAINDGVITDEYVYDQIVYDEKKGEEKKVLAKLVFEYEKDEEGNLEIREITMWRE